MKKIVYYLFLFSISILLTNCNKSDSELFYDAYQEELIYKKNQIENAFDLILENLTLWKRTPNNFQEHELIDFMFLELSKIEDVNPDLLKFETLNFIKTNNENEISTNIPKNFINELQKIVNDYKINGDYNDYLNNLLQLKKEYQYTMDPDLCQSIIEVHATVVSYWVHNLNKWMELSIQIRGGCDGIVEAAIDAAIVGCVGGAFVGGLQGCIVSGVISATGTTLWFAIKCVARALYEKYK